MKKLLLLIIGLNYLFAHTQNVGIGITTPESRLHIKGSADISQLTVDANTAQSNIHPIIRLRNANGKDLLHIHSDDSSNTFIGLNTGRSNASGLGIGNSFIGSNAGFSNNTGFSNTACGVGAFQFNTTGYYNTAMGVGSLQYNTTGVSNTAIGIGALNSTTTGVENTANGSDALNNNVTGNDNTADGEYALYSNIIGSYNTADGYGALLNTTASSYNTALGYNAGSLYDNGYNNVFLGANVDANAPGLYNVIAIGQGTLCSAPSQVTMGNGATNTYRAYANWSNVSDGRYKKNVQENVPGLDFINKLRPVTYTLDATGLDAFLHKNNNQSIPRTNSLKNNNRTVPANDDAAKAVYNKALKEKESVVYTGFVAQEVEATAKKLSFNFSGVDVPKNENDVYGLRYAEFVVPLVKAVQEQQQMIEDMKAANKTMQKQIDELKAFIKNR